MVYISIVSFCYLFSILIFITFKKKTSQGVVPQLLMFTDKDLLSLFLMKINLTRVLTR